LLLHLEQLPQPPLGPHAYLGGDGQLAIGYAALAVAIQGTDYFPIKVTFLRRVLFLLAATCFLLPMIVWLKIAGAILLALAWGAVPRHCPCLLNFCSRSYV